MSTKRDNDRIERPAAVPAEEDEADVVEEMGAEVDENGELQASVESVRKAGAIDIETVRRNRQIDNVAKRKQKGEKVSISTNDPLVKYEGLLKTWPTSTMHVKLRRLSGGPEVTEMITSFPRSATELYDEIRTKHGQCAEASYEVEFLDATSREWRGRARITLPDTRPAYMQGQPMHQNGAPPNGYPQQPQAPAPAGTDPMTMFRQMFELVQSVQPQQSPTPTWPQQPHQPTMPAPPTNPDPASMMKWFQEMFAIVRQAQPAPTHSPQPQMRAPTGPQMPTQPAPPGYKYQWLPESNCCVLEPVDRPMPERREPMYRGQREPGPRPYYPQQGDTRDRYDPRQNHQAPPDPLRESMSALRRAIAMREELDAVLGGSGQRGIDGGHFDAAPEQDPDSPVIMERTADVDLVRNREDGSIRGWDTLLVNFPSIIRKGGEYLDKISKTAVAERERRERAEQQQLAQRGYVRVTEDYEPPEGFVAVPVRHMPPPPAQRVREQDLPPPPSHVPPPIQDEPEPPPAQRGWDEEL